MIGFFKRHNLMAFLVVITMLTLTALPGNSRAIENRLSEISELIVPDVSWQPVNLVNGSPVLFRVKPEKDLKNLSGRWLGHQVEFDFDATDGSWFGFAGIGLDIDSGDHDLKLNLVYPDGKHQSISHSVAVGRGIYPSSALRVSRKFIAPDAETLARIKREQSLKREVFQKSSRQRLWKGNFAKPVDNLITSTFGSRRTFNGKLQSVHQGLDFRASTGTSVLAMNRGQVLLAQELFYEGGFVVIDHGHGLLSMYMHLSEIKTREGELINKGQEIALSGGTGRVTSPHLHLGVRWQGIYLDPATLLNMQLP